ncbi:glycosyl transferase [Metarhizium anisopliae]
MAAVFTPHWKKDSRPLSPTNWILYAVSKIHGHYYPLSVWCEENPSELHAGRQDDSGRGRGLVSSCLRTVSIFSNPNNRRAIQNELNMAKSFYQNPEHLVQPTFQLSHPSKSHPTSTQDDHVSV